MCWPIHLPETAVIFRLPHECGGSEAARVSWGEGCTGREFPGHHEGFQILEEAAFPSVPTTHSNLQRTKVPRWMPPSQASADSRLTSPGGSQNSSDRAEQRPLSWVAAWMRSSQRSFDPEVLRLNPLHLLLSLDLPGQSSFYQLPLPTA